MNTPFVMVLTGPAGAGKTTLGRKMAGEVHKCVNIEVDDLKECIVNGYAYEDPIEGAGQWRLLGDNVGAVARNFHDAEYNVIINGYIGEHAWAGITNQVAFTHRILLLPSFDVAMARETGRIAEKVLPRATIERHYAYFTGDPYFDDFVRLDSSQMTEQQALQALMEVVQPLEATHE